MATEAAPTPAGDVAERALQSLVNEIDRCVDELMQARARAENLLRERRSGRPWLDIVTSEARPLIVERISTVLGSLSAAGHGWGRGQGAGLPAAGVKSSRIAALLGGAPEPGSPRV